MSTNEKDTLKRIRIANLSRLAELNGSRSRLAEILGKAPQQINDMIRGTKSFGARIAREIEDKLGLPPGTLDTENAELGNPQVSTIRFKRIPILSYVQAGMLTDNGQEQYDEWAIAPETLPEKTFALRVRGDSMSPNFQEGQLLFVDPNRLPKPGDFVIARSTSGILTETTFKKYVVTGYDDQGRELFDLKPLNPDYPILHSRQHGLEVVGVVCGSFNTY